MEHRRLAVPTKLALVFVLCVGACATQPSGAGQHFAVFFQEWSAQLDTPAVAVIQSAADQAKANPSLPVTVIGFADPTGSPQANLDLSRLRTQLVFDQLVKDGVSPGRVRRDARGPTDFAQTAQESRRVEVRVGG